MEDIISEVVLRTDITKRAAGFHNKKFLGKPIESVQSGFNKTARRKLKHHSTMEDGRHVYHGIDHDGHHHFMVRGDDGAVHASVTAIKQGKSHGIDVAVAKPGAGVHKLYHHLITKHNHILTSKEQSAGGLAIWKKMRRMGGVGIHGYHPKTGRSQHVDIMSRPELSHVSQSELERQRRTKGGTKAQQKAEYADLKKTQGMIIVAHKNKNIRPTKTVRESMIDTIFRIIKESAYKAPGEIFNKRQMKSIASHPDYKTYVHSYDHKIYARPDKQDDSKSSVRNIALANAEQKHKMTVAITTGGKILNHEVHRRVGDNEWHLVKSSR